MAFKGIKIWRSTLGYIQISSSLQLPPPAFKIKTKNTSLRSKGTCASSGMFYSSTQWPLLTAAQCCRGRQFTYWWEDPHGQKERLDRMLTTWLHGLLMLFFFFPYGRSGRKRVWYYAHFSKLKAKPRRQVEHGLLLLALLYFTCYRIEQELSLVYQLLLSPTSSLHQTLPQPSLLAGYYGALGGGGHLLQDFRNPSD